MDTDSQLGKPFSDSITLPYMFARGKGGGGLHPALLLCALSGLKIIRLYGIRSQTGLRFGDGCSVVRNFRFLLLG